MIATILTIATVATIVALTAIALHLASIAADIQTITDRHEHDRHEPDGTTIINLHTRRHNQQEGAADE